MTRPKWYSQGDDRLDYSQSIIAENGVIIVNPVSERVG